MMRPFVLCTILLCIGLPMGCGSRDGMNPDASSPKTANDRDGGRALDDMEFSPSRYLADLNFVTGERVPGSKHWQEVQDLCAERLAQLGFEVELKRYATGTSVIGTLRGKTMADEWVVVGAHYDHIADCPGADDNGTGVAGVLEAARMLAASEHDRTLVIACWDEEERGLIGSMEHAGALSGEDVEVLLAISLDAIGYTDDAPNSQQVPPGFDTLFPEQVARVEAGQYRGDFITLIGDTEALPYMNDFDAVARKSGLPTLVLEATEALGPALANLVRSDHASFWQVGTPAILLTDSANFRNPNYHCLNGQDTVDTLNHGFTAKVVSSVAAVTRNALRR